MYTGLCGTMRWTTLTCSGRTATALVTAYAMLSSAPADARWGVSPFAEAICSVGYCAQRTAAILPTWDAAPSAIGSVGNARRILGRSSGKIFAAAKSYAASLNAPEEQRWSVRNADRIVDGMSGPQRSTVPTGLRQRTRGSVAGIREGRSPGLGSSRSVEGEDAFPCWQRGEGKLALVRLNKGWRCSAP